MREFLLPNGFIKSMADASLVILRVGTVFIYILIYVDDILITGSCPSAINKFIGILSECFSLKDLGDLSYFLGIKVLHNKYGIRLTQRKYTTDLLSRTHMLDAKPVQTPMSSTTILQVTQGTPLSGPSEYRAKVGSLQ